MRESSNPEAGTSDPLVLLHYRAGSSADVLATEMRRYAPGTSPEKDILLTLSRDYLLFDRLAEITAGPFIVVETPRKEVARRAILKARAITEGRFNEFGNPIDVRPHINLPRVRLPIHTRR